MDTATFDAQVCDADLYDPLVAPISCRVSRELHKCFSKNAIQNLAERFKRGAVKKK